MSTIAATATARPSRIKSWYQSIGELISKRGQRSFVIRPPLPPVSIAQARRDPTVISCVRVVARGIAQLKFAAEGSGSPDVNALLRRPNSWQTQYEFLHGVAFDTMLYGNSVLRKFRGPSGRVRVLAPLDPERISMRSTDMGAPEYRVETINETLASNDVIHIRDGGGHEPWAESRLESSGKRVRCMMAADDLITSVFTGGPVASYTLSSEKNYTQEQIDDLLEQYAKAFGLEGARRGGIVYTGKDSLAPLGTLKPADTDLRNLREDLKREIAALWGIPPFLVGAQGDTKYSNVTARRLGMYQEVFSPVAESICQALSIGLGVKIVCNIEELLRGDVKSQVTTAVQASGGPVMSPNESRQRLLGMEPDPDPFYDEIRRKGTPVRDDDRSGETPTDDGSTNAEEANERE